MNTNWTPIQKQLGWRVPPKPEPATQSQVTIRVEPEDAPPRYARVIDDEGRLQYYDLNP